MNDIYQNKQKYIELLEYSFFMQETCSYLEKKNKSKNSRIQKFLNSLQKHYWDKFNTELYDYLLLLNNYIFWQSKEIYLKSMEDFVAGKLTGQEFVNIDYCTLLNDRKKCQELEKLELSPESFEFSKIILSLENGLEFFSNEPDREDLPCFTEEQLRDIIKDRLPKVQKYFPN